MNYKILNFSFLQNIMMYILKLENAIKILVKDLREFIFEN